MDIALELDLEDVMGGMEGEQEKHLVLRGSGILYYQKIAYFDYTAAPGGSFEAHARAGLPFSSSPA